MATPESTLKKSICDYLATLPGWKLMFWIQSAGKIPGRIGKSRYQKNGIPDICAIYRGKPFYLEVKIPGNTLSPDQRCFFEHCNIVGGFAFEVKSIDDVKHAIASVDNFLDNK